MARKNKQDRLVAALQEVIGAARDVAGNEMPLACRPLAVALDVDLRALRTALRKLDRLVTPP